MSLQRYFPLFKKYTVRTNVSQLNLEYITKSASLKENVIHYSFGKRFVVARKVLRKPRTVKDQILPKLKNKAP